MPFDLTISYGGISPTDMFADVQNNLYKVIHCNFIMPKNKKNQLKYPSVKD